MNKVIVIGAGASGMMAAGFAAERGLEVVLIEKNDRPGRKLMITGKGRCNLTNACNEINNFLVNVPCNGRFLYSCVSKFGPEKTMAFFEEKLHLKLKPERGNRVFPQSDKAVDVVDALHNFIKSRGCKILKGRAANLIIDNNTVSGVMLESGEIIDADAVILSTGGKSYPLTGSTGDGYLIAEHAGHKITPLSPSLVPIETEEKWVTELQGLSLKNITLSVFDKKINKKIFEEQGEMLFTHFGVSGPLVLSASSHIRNIEKDRYKISLDLKPGLSYEQLDLRLQRDFLKYNNKLFINTLNDLLPSKMIPIMVGLSNIPAELKTNQITKDMRAALVLLFKKFEFNIKAFRPIEEAIITSGGVDVSEINPKTMESKLIKNLYFTGEIIDCDAYTGGFNLQIAFSTGYAAGTSILA